MPIFDFSCTHCLEQFYDVVVKLKDTAKQQLCPKCGEPMEKIPPRVSMQPKGAGTHRSDYNAPTRGY